MSPLLSGNGRHRRPRQAPNFVVAAGVTGAGLAIPLLGATAASAADNTTWDAVAECESGGLWSANEDNGYYGGLQLDQETWEEHGGTEYAERPDLASRDQQITVAERVLDAEGAEPFGDCAQTAGLSQDSPGSPDVDPDGSGEVADEPVAERPYPTSPWTDTPEEEGGASDPAESADPSDPAASPESGDPAESAAPEAPADEASDSPSSGDSSDPSGSDGSGDQPEGDGASDGGDYPYEPSDPVGPGGGDPGDGSGDGSGERPSRDGGDERPDAGGSGTDGDYRVSPGDSLSSIAKEKDVQGGWESLYERNRDLIGSDPDLILPGQELRL